MTRPDSTAAAAAALMPSETRRPEESRVLQQFSTSNSLGYVTALAARTGRGIRYWNPRS